METERAEGRLILVRLGWVAVEDETPFEIQSQRRWLVLDKIGELSSELVERNVGGCREFGQLMRIVEIVTPKT